MGSFKLGRLSLKGMFSRPATKMYPVVQPTYFERTAGHVVNERMKDCILCGMCAKRCPTTCIVVDKQAETWEIDPFQCVSCGSCVRVCPKQCLDMLPSYTAPAREKTRILVRKPELTPEEKAEKERAEAEKAARIAAARAKAAAAKAEKEASAQD